MDQSCYDSDNNFKYELNIGSAIGKQAYIASIKM